MSLTPSKNTGAYSKPAEFVDKNTPNQKWYDPEIGDRLPEESKDFYETYTGLKGDELISHLHRSRDAAWYIAPWPYVGQWGFLSTRVSNNPGFSGMLTTLNSGSHLLDLGCGLGQTLRYLAYRGASTENMYASDLQSEFWDAGYTLFRDKERFHAKFKQANILDENNALLADGDGSWLGKMDVIWLGNFLHAFNMEEQERALDAVVRLGKVGGKVVGTQWGIDWSVAAAELRNDKRTQGMNDDKTILKLWERVGTNTGTRWKVTASMKLLSEEKSNSRDYSWMPAGAVRLDFEAEREA